MKTVVASKSNAVGDKDDFLSAFFGETKKVQKENNTNDDFEFIKKGLDESQKKQEKQRSIFDGVGNTNLENILNSPLTKIPSNITKQKAISKSEFVFEKPADKGLVNTYDFTSKKQPENDVLNSFGKFSAQPTTTPDNDILKNLLNDLNTNPSNNKNNNNMFNINSPNTNNSNIGTNFMGYDNSNSYNKPSIN